MQWPTQGLPDNPKGWLITVATRRLTDQVRADTARRLREQLVVSLIPADEQIALAADAAGVNERDETLDLYFMCCHPALSPASQIALTLRAVGGLTTGEIARAFLVPEATMAQRLTRANRRSSRRARAFPELTPCGSGGPPAGRAQGAVPDFQRGIHGERRRPAVSRRSVEPKRSASPGCSSSCCPTNPKPAACSR